MGGEPVIIIPSNLLNTNLTGAATPACDDISDLASTDDHSFALQPEQDDDGLNSEDEDDFPDFPPNFNFQSKAIPPHFLCPLTKSVMLHPVIDAEGNTFERRAILRWLDLEDTSPVTGNSLSSADLVENKRRMAAIEAYREEVWNAYNAGSAEESLFKKEKRIEYKERNRKIRHEKKQINKGTDVSGKKSGGTMKYDLLTDKSNKLLMQMQEELDLLQRQHEEESEKHKKWLEGLNNPKKQDDVHHSVEQQSHVEYLLNRKREDKPKNVERDRIKSKRRDNYIDDADDGAVETALVVRKPSSRSPHPEGKTPMGKIQNPKSTLESSFSSQSRTLDFKKLHSERRSSRRLLQDPALSSSIKSTPSHRNSKVSPVPPQPTTRDDAQRHTSHSPHGKAKSLSCSNVFSVEQGGSNMLWRTSSCRNSASNSSTHDQTAKDVNRCSISERIIAEVNGCLEPGPLTRTPSASKSSFIGNPTTASTSSESQLFDHKRDHGWSVPIGVHKVICNAPGLLVTCDIHRRSAPVKRVACAKNEEDNSNNGARSRRKQPSSDQQVIIPPGNYIEVVETQVHGDRVRGKIVWDEEIVVAGGEPIKATRKRSSFMLGKLAHKKDKVAKNPEPTVKTVTHRYTGWVSLRWSGEKDESKVGSDTQDMRMTRMPSSIVPKPTDEDAGPWTEPVALGVYCITFSHGLPVRESPDRDSALVGMLERGQYVEVVETQVKGDRVRARCIPASKGEKSLNGWMSLFNAVTGSSGATAVPLGAYVAVSEANCTVTEGGSLNSKFRSLLRRGSCVEIVATRIEDGVVRGLISTGGHVTLIAPKQSQVKKNGKSSSVPSEEQYLMHVPTGVYKVVYAKGLPVFMGLETNSPSAMDLEVDSFVQVVETCVRNGRVCGRIISVINGSARQDLHGWIYLFESSRRWCKFAFA